MLCCCVVGVAVLEGPTQCVAVLEGPTCCVAGVAVLEGPTQCVAVLQG